MRRIVTARERARDDPALPVRAAELRRVEPAGTGVTRHDAPRPAASARSAWRTTCIGPGPALAATNHPVQDLAAIPAMAVAIEATSTINIGSRVFCTDYRQPVVFAKEMATLDFFSEGRLELGIGAGWLQGEYEAMGVPWDRAGVRLDRMRGDDRDCSAAHFADGEVDVHGTHVQRQRLRGHSQADQRHCRRS